MNRHTMQLVTDTCTWLHIGSLSHCFYAVISPLDVHQFRSRQIQGIGLSFLLSYCWVTWALCLHLFLQIRWPLPSMLNSCLGVSTPRGSTPSLSASSSSTGVVSALDNWDSYWLLHSFRCFCVPVIINTFAIGLIPCSTSTTTGRLLSSVCQDVSTCIICTA